MTALSAADPGKPIMDPFRSSKDFSISCICKTQGAHSVLCRTDIPMVWRYKKANLPPPDASRLSEMAATLVEDAHQIARRRGKKVWIILKKLVEDLKT